MMAVSSSLMSQVRGFSISTSRPPVVSRSFTTTYMSKKDQSFPTWSFDEPCASMAWSELVSASISVGDSYEDADLVLVAVVAPPKPDDEEESDDDEKDKNLPPLELSGKAKEIDDSLGGALSDLIQENGKTFKNGAKAGSTTPTLRVLSEGKSKRYIVVGLGSPPKEDDKDDASVGLAAKIGTTLATKCHDEAKVSTCALILPDSFSVEDSSLADLSTGLYETLYSDNRYRTGANVKPAAPDLTSVLLVPEASASDSSQAALDAGRHRAAGVFLAKDIVNAPHNVLNSESLADTAKRIAAESKGCLKCKILDKKECEKRGMGSYLGVARGSETDPQFIHLTYKPKSGDVQKKVGVIGKGLLFDTGGYNIKTQMMNLMKFDCGGAAAVLGAAKAVSLLEPEGVEAHFVVAACENMINQKAMVPSDVLTASNGKTIEVDNTDAEGRLTLADALVFVDKEVGAESIIELSTLTGACMVSLGKKICGVWTSNDELADELKDVSQVTGDKSWRMPLANEYNDQLESKIADIKNCGTPYGGAITAALFLQHFVDKKKPFAHIDIAGPVWDDKTGATGFGAKMVTEWVKRQGESK